MGRDWKTRRTLDATEQQEGGSAVSGIAGWGATFAEAISAIGSTEVTLQVDDSYTISDDLTVPANVELDFLRDGELSVAATKTLTIDGLIKAGPYQIFAGSGSVVFGDLAKGTVCSLWFASDEWDSFALAVDALEAGTGGTILLTPAVYDADKQVDISSEHPINLIAQSKWLGKIIDGASTAIGYIRPRSGLSGTDAIIRYVAPDSGTRWEHGGGKIEGLYFLDDSDLTNGTVESRRVVSIRAALLLEDFDLSMVKDCAFEYLKGSAIETERCVMSYINNPRIRYCGDTNKPSLWLNPQGSTQNTQSTMIDGGFLEANFNDDYLAISSDAANIRIANIGFEAINATASSADCQTYIDSDGTRIIITGCHFNKNGEEYLNISGHKCVLSDCIFDGDNENGRITWSGQYGKLANLTIAGAVHNTDTQITISNLLNSLSNISCKSGGNIIISGAYCRVNNLFIYSPVTSETYALNVTGERTSLSNIFIYDTDDDVGGINLGANYITLTGAIIHSIGTSGSNTAHAINNASNSQIISNCDIGTVNGSGSKIASISTTDLITNINNFETQATGTATISNPDTSTAVSHGLAVTPDDVQVTPTSQLNAATKFWITSIGSSTFTINVDTTPAASDTFMWRAARTKN